MIATSRKSSSTRTISRQYEFSRLQDQTLAWAYQALIPVASRRSERLPGRRDDRELFTGAYQPPQRSRAGA
jgi:hypothetical protein